MKMKESRRKSSNISYKQRVWGSNPSAPTEANVHKATHNEWLCCFMAMPANLFLFAKALPQNNK